jgi:hypothetical protein
LTPGNVSGYGRHAKGPAIKDIISLRVDRRCAVLVLTVVSLISVNQTAFGDEKGHSRLNLSLKLTAGLGYMRVGHLNSHIKLSDDYMSDSLAFYDGGNMAGVRHIAPNFEGELRVELNPRFALALGSGYLSESMTPRQAARHAAKVSSNHSDLKKVGNYPF